MIMTVNEIEKFESFLSESFTEGVRVRELRLSNEEMEYIKKKHPEASLKNIITREYSDGKVWCEMCFSK